MTEKRSAVAVCVALLLLAALSGCRRSKEPAANAPGGANLSAPGTQAAGPAGGKVLRLVSTVEPTTLDPALVTDGPSIQVIMHVLDGLVQWDIDNRVVPAVAERWDVSPDGRTYTFHLREGVRFHNGRTVTARDFEYSINRALNARASTVASLYLDDIAGAKDVIAGKAAKAKGIQAVDERTLRITIDAPRAYFLAKLTYPTAYVVCREAVEAGGRDWTDARPGAKTHYIGCGPFRMAEWQHGFRVVLAANDDYYGGRPKLDRIEIPVVEDAGTRLLKYENDEVDIVEAEVSDYPRLKKDPALSKDLVVQESPRILYLGLNLTFAPFKDVRVRRAFAQAIDKDKIVKVILSGVGRRADGILPPGIPGFDPALRAPAFDPARAKALLAEAGFPGGKGFPPLTLVYGRRWADTARVCQVIADMLKTSLGIPVGVQEMEWGSFLDQVDHSRVSFYHLTWMADYLDPQDFLSIMLRTGTSNNRTGYSNPEFDRLVDKADVTRDMAQRLALYRKAERIVVQDQPWVPLHFRGTVHLIKPRVRNLEISLMGILPHKRTDIADAP